MQGIPVNTPLLDGNEKKYLNECIDTGWISSEGPFVRRFEKEFSEYVGQKHAVAVTNGTVALDIAVKALNIGPGDEVIIPSFTIISCVSSVLQAGATPVVVDCTRDTWNMDVSKVEEKITSRTKAIMPVHIYGLPTDMDPLIQIAKKHNLKIIEDAAEAHGLTYKGKQCGSFGDISTFSFYPNKHITTGEGGMCMTSDDETWQRLFDQRNLCFKAHPRFVHDELGTNARMTNMQAALGVAQLEKIAGKIVRKRRIGEMYQELLKDIPGITLPIKKTDYADNIYWVFGILLDEDRKENAKDIMAKLADVKVGTRPFFYPLHKQPVLNKQGLFTNEHCPNSEYLAEKGFYIPSGLGLTDDEVQMVAERVRGVLK